MKSLDQTLASLSAPQLRLLDQWLTAVEPRRTSASQRKQIRAFVVTADGQTGDQWIKEDIKPYLASRLPHFMIPDRIELVESLPRLPNGKLDRSALRLRSDHVSQTDSDAASGFVEPRSDPEKILAQIWSESLQVEPIGVTDNFFELGGDSIISIQIVSKARDRGLDLSHSHFQNKATIAEMAAALQETPPPARLPAGTDRRHGEGKLTPIQHWFVQRGLSNPEHWNSARMFELHPGLSEGQVRAAVQACIDHHEGLRARFPQNTAGGIDSQLIIKSDSAEIFHALHADATTDQIRHFLNDLQARFALEDGPLIAVAYLPGNSVSGNPGGADRLFIVGHHLLLDNVSWGILTEDLGSALSALQSSRAITLPPQTTSVIDWSEYAAELADSEQYQESVRYWQAVETPGGLPLDFPLTAWPAEQSVKAVRSTLTEALTERLSGDAMKAYNTQVRDLLITALALTLSEWTDQPSVQFDLEGHGRDTFESGLNLTRTIGWFTSFFPHHLSVPSESTSGQMIKLAKESLRQLPDNGTSFGLLMYLSSSPGIRHSLESIQQSQVLFNYLGRSRLPDPSNPLRPCEADLTPLRALSNARSHLIEINAEISGGQLVSTWLYSDDIHRSATIETLAAKFTGHLEQLINHCLSSQAGGYTVSDFPEAALDQDDLDNLIDSLAPPAAPGS